MLYYVIYILLYPISILPFGVLHGMSDLMRWILFGVFGYRREVIEKNLKNSFPDKSSDEIKRIHRKYEKHFCDLILETITTLSISPRRLDRHVTFENKELFEKYFQENQSIILVLGHMGNWELIGAAFASMPVHKLNVIYRPLKSKPFNRLIRYMRMRLGNGLYPMKETARRMIADRKETTATAFIADQAPSPENAYWMEFLSQDTPVFLGTERLGRKFDYPIIYMSVRKPTRGHYIAEAQLLAAKPSETDEGDITELHTRRLEQDIRRQPEIWLWTHRRWKHKRPQ